MGFKFGTFIIAILAIFMAKITYEYFAPSNQTKPEVNRSVAQEKEFNQHYNH